MSLCSFLFFVLFSFFTSKLGTGMECHTCFIVYFRSVCVDSVLFELILFNLGLVPVWLQKAYYLSTPHFARSRTP